jgi:hypothetical protein
VRAQQSEKPSSESSVDTTVMHDAYHSVVRFRESFAWTQSRIWDDNTVEFLIDKPTCWLERSHQARQYFFALRQMHQNQAGVYQIKGRFRQGFADDIVAAHFEVGDLKGFEITRINISNKYTADGPDALCEPSSDGAATTAHL